MINVAATTYELLNFSSIKSLNGSPISIAGIEPMITLTHNWIVNIFCFWVFFGENGFSLWKYITTTASIAPSWITT